MIVSSISSEIDPDDFAPPLRDLNIRTQYSACRSAMRHVGEIYRSRKFTRNFPAAALEMLAETADALAKGPHRQVVQYRMNSFYYMQSPYMFYYEGLQKYAWAKRLEELFRADSSIPVQIHTLEFRIIARIFQRGQILYSDAIQIIVGAGLQQNDEWAEEQMSAVLANKLLRIDNGRGWRKLIDDVPIEPVPIYLVMSEDHITDKAIISHLVKIAKQCPPLDDPVGRVLQTLFDHPVLTSEQKCAIMLARMRSVAMIAGGPGSGKTQVVRAIIWAFRTAPSRAVVLATTNAAVEHIRGLVSDELGEDFAIKLTIETIHKEVKRCVMRSGCIYIIDESSMIDGVLYDLLRLNGGGNRYVFFGDFDQLSPPRRPSLFRRMRECLTGATYVLRENFRVKVPSLLANVERVASVASGSIRLEASESCVFIAEPMPSRWIGLLDEVVRGISAGDILWHLNTLIFIAYRNDHVLRINGYVRDWLEERGVLNRIGYKADLLIADQVVGEWDWQLGERCRITETVLSRRYFNGNLGFIRGIGAGDRTLVVELDKGLTLEIPTAHMWPAYCVTVHAAQGREWPTVVYFDHTSEAISRALLYVAISRAQFKLYVIRGSADIGNPLEFIVW